MIRNGKTKRAEEAEKDSGRMREMVMEETERRIGLSLGERRTALCTDGGRKQFSFPTVLCRSKRGEEWRIGEAALEMGREGSGFLLEQLFSLYRKGESASLGDRKYSAEELMETFLRLVLEEAGGGEKRDGKEEEKEKEQEESGEQEQGPEALIEEIEDVISEPEDPPVSEEAEAEAEEESGGEAFPDFLPGRSILVVSLRFMDQALMERLRALLSAMLGESFELCILTHTESFIHYMLRQEKLLYNRKVGMFELEDRSLSYYELRVTQGAKKCAFAFSEPQDESISLEALETESGQKTGDRILRRLAERKLQKGNYGLVMLCGKGFENTDFARNFMSYILKGRKVCTEQQLIALGALYYSEVLAAERTEDCRLLCDSRVCCDISLRVSVRERDKSLILASAGEPWMGLSTEHELILDGQNYIDFRLSPASSMGSASQLRMHLNGFPERKDRSVRIVLKTSFPDGEHFRVEVRDDGFGEIYPSSGAVLTEELDLRKTAGGA